MTTSVSPAINSPTAAQSAQNATSSAASGSTSPLAAVPAQQSSAPLSYANATKKTFSQGPDIARSTPPPAVGGSTPVQHGKSGSISTVNGQNPIQPALPNISGPTIAKGSGIANGASIKPDHSRTQSNVTINAPGGSYIPNGNTTALPSNRPNLQFGSVNAGSSPALSNIVPHHTPSASLSASLGNPRVTSPANSPQPIPQPPASGGRPPTGLPNQGAPIAFGNMGGEIQMRPVSMPPQQQNPVPPHPQHLRRESSQSAHGDMSGAGRGAFRPNTGRGGSYNSNFNNNLQYSPSPQYRPSPTQSRSNPVPQFPGQMGHPNSPFRQNRTPTLAPATMQQQAHFANNAQMVHPQYGYAQQHLQPQQGGYGMPPTFDPTYAAYYQTPYGMMPQGMAYPNPPSPRSFSNQPPHAHQAYMQGQYANMPSAHGMSRSNSQLSERPPSTLHQPPTPAVQAANHVSTPSQTSASPAPSSTFTIPARTKSKGIVIKNPDGEVVTFDNKKSVSPAPASKPKSPGPAIVSSTPTPTPPPPRAVPEQQHVRTESHSAKTAEDTKHDFMMRVRASVSENEAEKKRKEEEEAARIAKEKEEAEAKAAKEREEAEAKAAKEKEEAEKAAAEAKAKEEEEKAKKEAEEKKKREDEEFERMIAELEAKEREEEEREKAFAEKKRKQKEEADKKAAEAAANAEEELRRQEREAEALEEAKLKGKSGDGDSAESKAEAEKLFASLKKPTLGPGANAAPESGTSTPVSDTSMPPPAQPASRAATGSKPKPHPLKLQTDKPVEPAQPTAGMQALRSARFIMIQNEIKYPEGVQSPNPALIQSSKSGKGRQYDLSFLKQFQTAYKEKPSVDWDQKLKETVGDSSDSARPQSARTPSMGMGSRQGSRPGLPSTMSAGGVMGNFGQPGRTLPPGTTSQERFNASMRGPPTMINPLASLARQGGGFPMGAPPPMSRTNSLQAMGQPNSPRTNSTRGKGSRRGGLDKAPSRREEEQAAKTMPLTAGMELKPLEVSSSGWKPASIVPSAAPQTTTANGLMAPDMVQRKVKAALNKMTPENFDRIADQILDIAAQSKHETDGRTLRQVIQLTFEKACDEAHWASMYAKFCKRMLETMNPDVKDENVRDKAGNPVVGGALFRKYLLNRCQEEFERGWDINLPTKAEGEGAEALMLSDEYYIAAAAKRRGLGLIQFIGELYKLGMLTLRIMHECVLKLLNFEGMPEESSVESLVKLLRTIGATMDSTDNGPKMIALYFERIEKVMAMEGLPSRLRFMLLDTVDLRKKAWRSKEDSKGPKTISEIHAEAAAAQQAAEVERQKMNQRGGGGGGGRMPMGRGDARSFSSGGMMPPPSYSTNVGVDDLRKLSKNARNLSQGPGSFGPSMFASRSSSGRKGLAPGVSRAGEESAASSRTATPPSKEKESTTSVNAFSALAGLDASGEGADDVASPPSTASSPPVAKTQPADIQTRSKSPGGAAASTEGA
ncbi:hypothetical protein M501DRAFT_926231 [Patellaria atrata CBS 101060]|uniref:MIF4G domain-containing protein n=1 Tax=Patellaria atrata CBS 101060 TaxID=1346257 RepID=A0A9P4SII3_9PEZI|nr:hypothetical protein M501DRAFT_926231 [Patellaria atrata CBS 101060]